MLAREIERAFVAGAWEVTMASRALCNIELASDIERVLTAHTPALVVNCAAYTDVERAEVELERAFAVNATAVATLARVAASRGVAVLHISTDYVFDGLSATPYREDSPANPLGAYARSKYEGEQALRQQQELRFWVVRTGELYGDGGKNFFFTIFRAARTNGELRVVRDQIVSPTWTRELAQQLLALVQADAPNGTYHATARGQVSWYEAACFALERMKIHCNVVAIRTADHATRVQRPLFTVLAPAALEALGIYRMRRWDEALSEWIEGSR